MAREEAHEAGAGINGATVTNIAMRETGSERALKVEVYEGTRGRKLIGIALTMERKKAGACISHSLGYREVITQVRVRRQASVGNDISNPKPYVTAGTAETMPQNALWKRMRTRRERGRIRGSKGEGKRASSMGAVKGRRRAKHEVKSICSGGDCFARAIREE